jgi:hypothetical protein
MSYADVVSPAVLPPGTTSAGLLSFAGGVSPLGVAPVTAKAGDIFTSTLPSSTGGLDASWVGAVGTVLKAGDILFYSGTAWYVFASKKDLGDFLSLTGGTMKPNSQINLNDGVIVNAHLDNGRF